jgi:hypothetical protein
MLSLGEKDPFEDFEDAVRHALGGARYVMWNQPEYRYAAFGYPWGPCMVGGVWDAFQGVDFYVVRRDEADLAILGKNRVVLGFATLIRREGYYVVWPEPCSVAEVDAKEECDAE